MTKTRADAAVHAPLCDRRLRVRGGRVGWRVRRVARALGAGRRWRSDLDARQHHEHISAVRRAIREDLNASSPRVMAVLRPLEVNRKLTEAK